MNTAVEFTSSKFNSTEPKDYFINPCCFGDDVCRWLIGELRERGIAADEEPGQEDWGWYLSFTVDGAEHLLSVGFQPEGDSGRWLGFLERTGALRTLFGRRRRDVLPGAVEAIAGVLAGSPEIRDVRWTQG